ncbi:hypothetical protein ACRE_061970 [Hapsidospora chrysogenum ATCC 11550]|uniref:Uncharacterized protein n=1 Tax=Hapsidospora chrysogenum (strain ATCC 11550 / CBS 779.69 / DSM 880 / IAM 14645 / JCM 23072 / IMI 49137) TaxID=857340 RepID=A0A086T143_HAPC1|nr:hypothetical protein ACRE_061970 [Hapsidospora chrysogenum ATCC 11550]
MSIPRKPVPGTPDRSTTSSIIMPTPPSSSGRANSSRHPSNPFYAASSSASESLLDTPNPDLGNTAPRIQVSESPSTRTDHKVGGPSTRPRSSSARAPKSPSATTLPPPRSQQPSTRQRSASHSHTRNNSLPQRFPGDMSHRPLAILKRENRAANRSSRHRRAPSQPDTIDALDTIGGGYHHDGPYEATLASRNVNVRYSPLEAVRNSNMEALRATPREFIEDSLRLHVPLQGTSIVPSGGLDMSGNVMTYREGADLMRESDAPGGPYRRYQDVHYHPDDLKGKGEPSFTYERDLKAKKREHLLRPGQHPDDVELSSPFSASSSSSSYRWGRHRSLSNGAYDDTTTAATPAGRSPPGEGGMQRSNTTGRKTLGEGLKRRFGSLRRKKDMPAGQVE